jgi:hypothetical protein
MCINMMYAVCLQSTLADFVSKLVKPMTLANAMYARPLGGVARDAEKHPSMAENALLFVP